MQLPIVLLCINKTRYFDMSDMNKNLNETI